MRLFAVPWQIIRRQRDLCGAVDEISAKNEQESPHSKRVNSGKFKLAK